MPFHSAMDPPRIVLANAIVLGAMSVRGFAGFGAALVMIPLLAMLPGLKMTIGVSAIITFVTGAVLTCEARRHVEGFILCRLLLSGAVGIPLGVYALAAFKGELLEKLFGITIILFALCLLLSRRNSTRPKPYPSPALYLAGVLSGLFGGLFGAGSPPVVIYLSYQSPGKEWQRATLVAYFLVVDVLRLTLYVFRGLITASTWRWGLLLLPIALIGTFAGRRIELDVSEQTFRFSTALILLTTGGPLSCLGREEESIMDLPEYPFNSLVIPSRSAKPRERGITMLVDWGLGLRAQRDCLEVARAYIDLAKIAVGISGLLRREYLAEKIRLYQEHQVETFPGGQFLEYALRQGRAEAYFQDAWEAGYRAVEVSDNIVEIPVEEKWALIRQAQETYGFRVLGEVGRKVGTTTPQAMVEDIRGCLAAGAWKVFVEAMELYRGGLEEALIEECVQAGVLDQLIFELPGTWIEGVHEYDRHQITSWFLRRFGQEVNLANVEAAEVIKLETLRRGIGVEG